MSLPTSTPTQNQNRRPRQNNYRLQRQDIKSANPTSHQQTTLLQYSTYTRTIQRPTTPTRKREPTRPTRPSPSRHHHRKQRSNAKNRLGVTDIAKLSGVKLPRLDRGVSTRSTHTVHGCLCRVRRRLRCILYGLSIRGVSRPLHIQVGDVR